MVKHPSPPDTGIDPILADLDNLHINDADDDDLSAPSVTPRSRAPSDLHGESSNSGGELASNSSMPDSGGDTQRTVIKNGVGIIGFFKKENPSSDYCCGFVGVGQVAFCLKKKGQCDTAIHKSSKFTPKPFHYYIQRSSTGGTAWCQPCVSELALHKLPNAEKEILPATIQKTLKGWKATFDAAKSMNSNSWGPSSVEEHIAAFKQPPTYDAYKTPAKFNKPSDPFDKLTHLSSDVEEAMNYVKTEDASKFFSSDINESENAMTNLLITLQFLLEGFEHLVDQVRDKANLQDVANDINNVTAALAGLKSDVGNNTASSFPDLWSAISEISTVTTVENWEQITSAVKALQEEHLIMSGHHAIGTQRWEKLAKNWIPLLVKHDKMVKKMSKYYLELSNRRTPPVSLENLDTILDRHPSHDMVQARAADNRSRMMEETLRTFMSNVDELETRMESLERNVADRDQSPTWDNIGHHSLATKLEGLGMTGVTYRDFFFRDIDSLRAWMKHEMDQPCHGLFVDIVSFMEFLGGERYVECNTTLNDLYLTNKVGFATQSDAIVSGSFQNVLPGAFGRRPDSEKGVPHSVDFDAQPELPGMTTFAKWDHRDGSSGRKYWIKKESRNAYKNLDGMIRHQLKGRAQMLATNTLMDSKAMCDSLQQFISNSYEDTMHSGRFDSAQAWRMVCKFVKRVFSEIGDVRVVARNGIDIEDKWTTSARFLFATLKAHEIMEAFMRLNIKDHPSISSEMVKFICYSQPSTDTAEVMGRLGNLETLQRGDQSQISKLETKVKALTSWKTDAEKLLKQLKEKL